MGEEMRFIYHSAGLFFCGVVFAANMSLLVGINETFTADWWKVAFSLIIAVAIFIDIIWKTEK